MTIEQEVDDILSECFLAVGQAVGPGRRIDFDALTWWRARYREAFRCAVGLRGNSWVEDRDRVTAVGRYLGLRAVYHAGESRTIDIAATRKASAEVEAGCHMQRLAREH
jgi:hypothetical protein